MLIHVSTNYDELIHLLANYQSQMAARNAASQARLSQMTQELPQPLEREAKLVAFGQAFKRELRLSTRENRGSSRESG